MDIVQIVQKLWQKKELKSYSFRVKLFLVTICLSFNLYADDSFFCFSNNDGKSILLVSKSYPNINDIMYYPYLKKIKLSDIVNTKYGDTAGNKPEVYYTMNEIVNNKTTGRYTFMSQGVVIYNITYENLKTKKKTNFSRLYDYEIGSKKISCL